jgi:hypothetical protein
MIEYLALGCLVVAFLVILVKAWNVLNFGKVYEYRLVLVGLGLILIMWGVYFVCTFTALQGVQTWDFGDGSPDVTYTGNGYLILINLLVLFNWFIGIGVALTAIEFIMGVGVTMLPKGFVRKNNSKGILGTRR